MLANRLVKTASFKNWWIIPAGAAVAAILLLNGCKLIELNGSLGGLTSQFNSSYRECDTMYYFVEEAAGICDSAVDDRVLIVSDHNVQLCINRGEELILYRWSPFCSSDFCYPLALVYATCRKFDLTFLPISEYYDNEAMAASLNKGFPLLAPNISFYKTNFTDKYLSRFFSNLHIPDYQAGRFYYFRDGKFVQTFESIGDIAGLK